MNELKSYFHLRLLLLSFFISIDIITLTNFITNFSKFGWQMQIDFGIRSDHVYSIFIASALYFIMDHQYRKFAIIPFLLYDGLLELVPTPAIISNDPLHYWNFVITRYGLIDQVSIILTVIVGLILFKHYGFTFRTKIPLIAFILWDSITSFDQLRYHLFPQIIQINQEWIIQIVFAVTLLSTIQNRRIQQLHWIERFNKQP